MTPKGNRYKTSNANRVYANPNPTTIGGILKEGNTNRGTVNVLGCPAWDAYSAFESGEGDR